MVENVPTYPKAEETIYNVAEIAKKVRAFIKSNYPKSKYSVQKKDNTLNVKLMKSPKMPFTDEYRRTDYDYLGSYWSVNHHSIERDERLEDWIKEEFQHIVNYANQWNWDRSDIQTDYFDVNFYWNLGIGAWNKPFEYTGAPLEDEEEETEEEYSEVKLNPTDGLKYRYSKKLYAESPTDALAGIQFQDPEYVRVVWEVYNFPENYDELQRWKTGIFKIFPELAIESYTDNVELAQTSDIGFSRVKTSEKFGSDYKYPIANISDEYFPLMFKMRYRPMGGGEEEWAIIDYDEMLATEGWVDEMHRLFPELDTNLLEPEVTSETPPSSNDPQFDVGDYIKYPQAEEYGRVIAIRAIDINNPNLGYEYSAQYPNGDIITIADIDHPVKLEGDIDDGRGRELTEMGKCQFDMELINRTTAVREFVTKYGEIIYSINKNEIICKLVEAVHKFAEYELCADELPAVAKSATLSLKDKLKKLKKK